MVRAGRGNHPFHEPAFRLMNCWNLYIQINDDQTVNDFPGSHRFTETLCNAFVSGLTGTPSSDMHKIVPGWNLCFLVELVSRYPGESTS